MTQNLKDLARAVDTEIYEKSYQLFRAESEWTLLKDRSGKVNQDRAERLANKALDLRDTINALERVHYAYGWTRGYIVPGGHVHSSRQCQTLFHDTVIYPVPVCSALNQDEIIALAADRACTICYPKAPVVKKGTCTLVAPGEDAKAQRKAEREAKAAEKEAKKVTVVFGTKFDRRGAKVPDIETYGTVRSARIDAMDAYGWAIHNAAYYDSAEMIREYMNKFHKITEAITAHRDGGVDHIDTLEAELLGKARAKFIREVQPAHLGTGYKGLSKAEAVKLLSQAEDKIAKAMFETV